MKRAKIFLVLLGVFMLFSCQHKAPKPKIQPFIWEGANVYFLLTDRFNNGDASNDVNFNRTDSTAVLRGFEGGDLKGVIQKIKEGYFSDLGINAIWMTPLVEQIQGGTDEGTGLSYGFHGYWASDWTSLDPNFGTKEDLHELIDVAHQQGIRVLLDAVINHTGPVTDQDSVWPNEWVRTEPTCNYETYESTVTCTLVENLPDIRTESNEAVNLPPQLLEKWKKEGRYEEELEELDAFFKRTGYPKAPRFYIMKWLSDYIVEFGIDGYRVDTVKHTEDYVWQEFKKVCDAAFATFKNNHPEGVLDDNEFFLVGEVYNYNLSDKKAFNNGGKRINYYDNAFNSLINFELKWKAAQETTAHVFQNYSDVLHGDLKGYTVLNYLSSHDDGSPYDAKREKPYESAIKLLLCPGMSQVYYGDESARVLDVEGAKGDAKLRSFMNWEAIKQDAETKQILQHWQKLGKFRANHPAVGAGIHNELSKDPFIFSRQFSKDNYNDLVLIGLGMAKGEKEVNISDVFKQGDVLRDAYSGVEVTVDDDKIRLNTPFNLILLERI
ncbi:alpha-amylase [Tamlana fucoidanivorans]|uniref:Alpha-amlyase n=1 Tax=Allotamlana fucoidanivorans TaxID=2583814 RepID=A0A5C4SMA7_9FLAO|nr:alpha-amylase family glycosyl hydrolase [Tamlana fucoidanivorans]TNJ45203.1 alpha-amlyase [Tamlana fucoidanivorans]